MPLIGLGLVTTILGVVLSIQGLILAGGVWVVLGFAIRVHNRRIERAREANTERASRGEIITKGVVTGRMFALSIALVGAVALVSLAIGIFNLGIDSDDEVWRWLPLGVGILALVLTLVAWAGSLAGVRAPASAGGISELPALVTIEAVRDTGAFVGNQPILHVEMQVEVDGAESYHATQRMVVPLSALATLVPGSVLEGSVRAGEERGRVTLDWGARTGRTANQA